MAAHLNDVVLADVAGRDHLADEVVVVLLAVAEGSSPEMDELMGVSGIDGDLEFHAETLGLSVGCVTIAR